MPAGCVQDGAMAVSRRYGGQTAVDRVAERRARLLARRLPRTDGNAGHFRHHRAPGVAEASGVAARYFYESFADVEALHLAVYTEVIEEAARRSVAALEQSTR